MGYTEEWWEAHVAEIEAERDRYREALEKARNLLLSDGLLMANTPSTWNRFLGDMHAALSLQEEE